MRLSVFLVIPPLFLAHDAGATEPRRLFAERATLRAADAVCGLFTDDERMALAAGYWQARGELLRVEGTAGDPDGLLDIARARVRELGCGHRLLQQAASRLRASFPVFVRERWMQYPSRRGLWTARRGSDPGWSLVQEHSHVRLGLRREGEEEQTARFAVELRLPLRDFAGAGIAVRDPARLDAPWLGDLVGRNGKLRPPPASTQRLFWADDRRRAEDGAVFWLFPSATIDALAVLDPREALLAVFRSPDGTSPDLRIVFEVGDFVAGRAFSMIADEGAPPKDEEDR